MIRNTLKKLYFKYCVGFATAGANIANERQLFELKAEALRHHTFHSNQNGVTMDRICDKEVIVSLTTYGRRIYDVYLTIESIMQGSIKPNRIILWLAEEFQCDVLPRTLQLQMDRGLQIGYTNDIRSYKKLIPTIKKYPESICVTIDDDVLYNFDLLENLINSYNKDKATIHASRVHRITFNHKGEINPYNDWEFGHGSPSASIYNFATGCGGILYPPHTLLDDVLDEETFMELAPCADDVWFYAMAIANGTLIKKAFTRSEVGEDFLINENAQLEALNHSNVGDGKNDKQIRSVFEKYNIYQILNNHK